MKNFNLNQWDEAAANEEQQLHKAGQSDDDSLAFDRLNERFSRATGKLPWLIRKKAARLGAYRFSFLCNLVSILAGWYGGKVFMEILPIPYLNYVLAFAALILMEKYKRTFSDEFWDTYWAKKTIRWDLAGKNFFLLLVSIGLSVGGMFFAVTDLSPEAKYLGLTDNPEAVAIQDRIDKLGADIDALREDKANYNSKGEFYHIHAKKENLWAEEKATLTKELKEVHGVQIIHNEDIKEDYELRGAFRAGVGIIVTLLAEIIFEFCMAFCSLYDFRHLRYLAVKRKNEQPLARTPNGKKHPALAMS